MKIHKIHAGTGDSCIYIGEPIRRLERYLPPEGVVIITDTNVERLYAARFPPGPVIRLGTGERSKTLDTVANIYDQLLNLGADRNAFILGIGGGVVCDIAGFAACTYLRGVRFGFVASTLLAQVDASVGGKNGVNFKGYKNMVGVFQQPEFVLCDMEMLQTLPAKEILSGLAEVVKHAAIGDAAMFAYLEANAAPALSCRADVIERLVSDSVRIKSAVVAADEKESGERRKLNFGHTFGHAVEKTLGMTHGEAVSIGMAVATALSVKRGLLAAEAAQRIHGLLKNLKLPTRLEADRVLILDAIKKDKKREGNTINFVLLDDIGKAVIQAISIRELAEVMDS